MEQAGIPGGQPDPSHMGPLSPAEARAMLQRADELLASGDFADAGRHYFRVVGSGGDPAITAAGLLGLGEARYRLDDDAGALSDWEAVLRLPETPSTYAAYRNVAAARVRSGDLAGARAAYQQADRRAPQEHKAEIASRLGWLTKELGDTRSANRYFAKSRNVDSGLGLAKVIVAVTVIVSATVLFSTETFEIYRALVLNKGDVADGEYWRLLTVTLLHGSPLHLFFNMYALWMVGPLVERWYGTVAFGAFYVACAATGSVASFAFGPPGESVGASGAVFGLFGILAAASRLHHPADRHARAIAGQIGMIIVINLAFGFLPGTNIDNAAHIGGLLGGLWLGAMLPPTRVQTLSSLWQRAGTAGMARVSRPPAGLPVVAGAVVVGLVFAGLVYGTAVRGGDGIGDVPTLTSPVTAAPLPEAREPAASP